MSDSQTRITPFLWFNSNADEAVDFYLQVFPDARRTGGLAVAGKTLTIAFELQGQAFTALNGGPQYTFTEAVSFVVQCESQEEVDRYWYQLSAGSSEGRCGWLKDKYGLSWQIVPTPAMRLLQNPKAMQALMGMTRIVVAELEQAAAS